jgi:hypothetical protein
MKRKRRLCGEKPTHKIFKSKDRRDPILEFDIPTGIHPNTLVLPYTQEPYEPPDEKYHLAFRCSDKSEFVRGLASRIQSMWDFKSRVKHDNYHVGKLERIIRIDEDKSEWTTVYEEPDCPPLTWTSAFQVGEYLHFSLIDLDAIPPATHSDTHVQLLIEHIGHKYEVPKEVCLKIWEYVAYAYNYIPIYRPK